ncbi:MAG: hypothetical protein ACNA7V_04975 [Bacteroidales bacterium]
MQKHFFYNSLLGIFTTLMLCTGCQRGPEFEVSGFNPLRNYASDDHDTLYMELTIPHDIFEGMRIPGQGYFQFSFQLKNNGKAEKRYYYKILYQNESYKFAEGISQGSQTVYNPLAAENFYGSWEEQGDTLHLTHFIPPDGLFHIVIDSFRIVGNPRNETLYFGRSPEQMRPTSRKTEQVIQVIRNTPEWMEAVTQKALDQKREVDEQLYLDALWVISHESDQGDYNARWKRNPRSGVYRFALVVVPEGKVIHVPQNVRNLNKKAGDSLFINPFFTILYNEAIHPGHFVILESPYTLKSRITFDMTSGIYVDPLKFANPSMDSSHFSDQCNNSEYLFRHSQIEQFFHNIDKSWIMHNIPVLMDYTNFSVEDYKRFEDLYDDDRLRHDYIRITDCPCKTVEINREEQAVYLTNPSSVKSDLRKENVGIQSRVGFTYGKVTAKIKFPELLNHHNVWNGITSAFWLIYQGEGEWNLRRECVEGGYIPKSEVGETDVREPRSFYSEIDIEIVKASKHWPPTSYYNNIPYPYDDPDDPGDIIVTTTNWDLACRDPEKFNVGVFDISHNGITYLPHRWDHWYKALTMKYTVNHNEVLKRDFYYYQIDWRPDCIIWRIGPDKENMMTVGYLDTSVSSIPNNQMTFVVTQEYHHSAWWPTTEFKQEFIPYPASPVIGKVLGVEIE